MASARLPPSAMPLSGAWGVRGEDGTSSPPNAICETGTRESAALSLGDTAYTDLRLSARFKLISGRNEQTAGLIFRVGDKDNYYILEATVLADSVGLSKYADGRRGHIREGLATLVADRWQQRRVEATGNRLRGFLNDQLVVEATDDTHKADKVGLWMKADSAACFDDIDARAR